MDISLNWAGDITFTASGGIATVTDAELAAQRLARRLLSTSGQYDAQGHMVVAASDMFNPEFGEGLGIYVDAVMDASVRDSAEARAREAAAKEPIIDPNVPCVIEFYEVQDEGYEIMTIIFKTVSGEQGQLGIKL